MKEIEIPEGYEARIEGNKVILELKESEDERIRKYLIDFVGLSDNPRKGEMIAYLEKQKEQKHPNGCFTCDEYKKGYEEGRRNGFTAGYNKAMKEVEQKEQKPAMSREEILHQLFQNGSITLSDYLYLTEEQKPVDDKAFEEWIDDWYQGSKEAGGDIVMSEAEFKNWSRGIRNMYQQKPAWSEEEKDFMDGVIARIFGSPNITTILTPDDCYKFKKALTEIRNKMDLQCSGDERQAMKKHTDSLRSQPKPAEWSEEDENKIKDIIDYLECWNDFDHGSESFEEYRKRMESNIQFMKSLRPSWKPSEEQMEELWNVISYIELPGSNFLGVPALLESLYEELKKL